MKKRLVLLFCAWVLLPRLAGAQTITVGATSSTSDAPIYIADKKGYFRAEGLAVKVSDFRSAADMVAPLGAGQLQAGAESLRTQSGTIQTGPRHDHWTRLDVVRYRRSQYSPAGRLRNFFVLQHGGCRALPRHLGLACHESPQPALSPRRIAILPHSR